jgi:hypothetical protein
MIPIVRSAFPGQSTEIRDDLLKFSGIGFHCGHVFSGRADLPVGGTGSTSFEVTTDIKSTHIGGELGGRPVRVNIQTLVAKWTKPGRQPM